MAPRKVPGVTIDRNGDGTVSYRIRWRQGGRRTDPQLTHSFSRLAEASSALAAIKANGNLCDCPKHATGAGSVTPRPDARLAFPNARSFDGAVRAHAQALTGVGDDYRVRFERDLLRHFADFQNRPVDTITAQDVRLWIRGCEEGTHPWLQRRVKGTRNQYRPVTLSPVTTRRLLVQAGSVIRQLGLSPNPFTGHRVGRRDQDKHETMKMLSPEEWVLIRDALPAGWARDFCILLVTTGLRFGEAAALQVGDVDLLFSELRVRHAWKAGGELGPPKSARSRRTVDFGPTTHEVLVRHMEGRRPTDWVFTSPQGGPIHASNFYHRQWAPALDVAEARGLTRRPRLHDLRHTYVSWQLAAGVPIFEVSRRVGHESITTTTDRYGWLLPRESRSAVNAIERAMGQVSSPPSSRMG